MCTSIAVQYSPGATTLPCDLPQTNLTAYWEIVPIFTSSLSLEFAAWHLNPQHAPNTYDAMASPPSPYGKQKSRNQTPGSCQVAFGSNVGTPVFSAATMVQQCGALIVYTRIITHQAGVVNPPISDLRCIPQARLVLLYDLDYNRRRAQKKPCDAIPSRATAIPTRPV